MQVTADVRKALGDKTRIERDRALAKEEATRKALLEVSHNVSWQPPQMRISGLIIAQMHKSKHRVFRLGQGTLLVYVLLCNLHMSKMLLAASEGEVSSTVEHEAKLREKPYATSKVIAIQPGPSKALSQC